MSKPKRKTRKPQRERPRPLSSRDLETGDVATVAWGVTVTMVTVCDLVAIGAHVYLLNNPGSQVAMALGGLMLLGGALIGLGTLALTPVVFRVRREAPPTGFVVFALCAALAPMLALAARAFQQA
jgi:hypothetical protein